MSVYHRKYRLENKDKERKWRQKYLDKPETQQKLLDYQKAYQERQRNTPEKIQARIERAANAERRRKEKEARSAAFAIVKQERLERKRQKELKKLAKALRARLNAILALERKLAYQEKLAEAARKRQERNSAEAIARRAEKEANRLARLKEQENKRKARELLREQLKNQHGTIVGDYDRCRKANGTACDPCRAVAAAYVRNKWKTDPKYKATEKEYYKRNPHKRLANSARDRAKRKGVPTKYYTRDQIFKRDGYDCHICKAPVDLTANHVVGQPGWELYPHIDHVIPIALGGHDTLDNVKIAHAKCNIDKGANLL